MDKILNLTQHDATAEQIAEGVVDPASFEDAQFDAIGEGDDATKFVRRQLTFDRLPTADEIIGRALMIAEMAASTGCKQAMIGGAPYLMAALEQALRDEGIEPVYAFSVRESVEETMPDGSVRKTQKFRHAGWVPAVSTTEGW